MSNQNKKNPLRIKFAGLPFILKLLLVSGGFAAFILLFNLIAVLKTSFYSIYILTAGRWSFSGINANLTAFNLIFLRPVLQITFISSVAGLLSAKKWGLNGIIYSGILLVIYSGIEFYIKGLTSNPALMIFVIFILLPVALIIYYLVENNTKLF